MASRYSGEGGERKGRSVSSTGCEQYDRLSDDSTGPSGLCESGENADDSFLFRVCERTFSEEDMRDVTERVPESGVVTMVQDPIYRAVNEVSETNNGDRPHKWNMSHICSSTLAREREGDCRKRNNVTFNPEVTVHLTPYEDRKSEWVQAAIDRCHFQRRIQLFEELFTAL